jgi:hypothetical protein
MPALSGQIIMTVTDAAGFAAVTVTWFFNPTTRALRNNPTDWTDPTGQVWAAGSGALIAANTLGRPVKVRINDAEGNQVRRVTIPIGGRALKAVPLANAPAPDGPYTVAEDLNGVTFDLSLS